MKARVNHSALIPIRIGKSAVFGMYLDTPPPFVSISNLSLVKTSWRLTAQGGNRSGVLLR
jgi:hypothetical protein